MSWKEEVEQAAERRARARELGGAEAVARQHAKGRLTVRERIERLIDPGSFREEGPQAGSAELDDEGRLEAFHAANYVLGIARIDGRPVVVGGEDFTQRGGSPSPAGLRKSIWSETLALRLRLPLVRFLEGGGGSVTGTGGKKSGASRPLGDPVFAEPRFASIGRILEVAPVASAAVGPVAGFPAARLVASHFSVMTRRAQVLIAGPAVVERALGRRLSKEELGGPEVHLRSGVVDNLAEDEEHSAELIRRFLSYLPTNSEELAPVSSPAGGDGPDRREQRLLDIVPRDRRRHYDMREVVGLVVDQGSFFELAPEFGCSQICGLARFAGRPVGIWGNDSVHDAGAMGASGAQKVRRFLELCETFHLPVAAFVDEPGFMIGLDSERAGTIRFGFEAIRTAMATTVPWVSILVRKAYGVAAAAHFGPEARVLAWPSAESGALPVEGGVAVAFRREIAAAPDPESKRRELEEAMARRRNPFARAESFSVHDLIDPRDTRLEICRWLDLCQPLLERRLTARRRD